MKWTIKLNHAMVTRCRVHLIVFVMMRIFEHQNWVRIFLRAQKNVLNNNNNNRIQNKNKNKTKYYIYVQAYPKLCLHASD